MGSTARTAIWRTTVRTELTVPRVVTVVGLVVAAVALGTLLADRDMLPGDAGVFVVLSWLDLPAAVWLIWSAVSRAREHRILTRHPEAHSVEVSAAELTGAYALPALLLLVANGAGVAEGEAASIEWLETVTPITVATVAFALVRWTALSNREGQTRTRLITVLAMTLMIGLTVLRELSPPELGRRLDRAGDLLGSWMGLDLDAARWALLLVAGLAVLAAGGLVRAAGLRREDLRERPPFPLYWPLGLLWLWIAIIGWADFEPTRPLHALAAALPLLAWGALRRWRPVAAGMYPALAVAAGVAVWLALRMQAGAASGLLVWLAAALLAVVTVVIPLLQAGGRTSRDPILYSAVAPSLVLMLVASAFAGSQTFESYRPATWFGWAVSLYVARDVLVYALVCYLAPGERYAGVLWMVWMLIAWAVVGPGLDWLGVPPPWSGIVVISPDAVSWTAEEGGQGDAWMVTVLAAASLAATTALYVKLYRLDAGPRQEEDMKSARPLAREHVDSGEAGREASG